MKTLEITNFTGALTRKKNGDINSGLAKFSTSFGYDPFTKPGQLTWFEAPVDITGSTITDLIMAAKPRFEGSNFFIYAIGTSNRLYKIMPNSSANANLDTSSVIATLSSVAGNVGRGASMDFYGATEKIYIGMSKGVISVNFDGSSETLIGNTNNYVNARYRPLTQFIGKLIFGNGANIGVIDSTGTITSSPITPSSSSVVGQLSPTLPPETYISDLDISPEGNYLFITTSGVVNEVLNDNTGDLMTAGSSNGSIYRWNGTDVGATGVTTIPSYAVTALQIYLDNNYFFSNDSFGASLSNGSQKLVTLPDNKSPNANATLTNGNFISWIAPELSPSGTGRNASMYYFGNLDEENPKGLWRVMRYSTTLSNGFIYNTPVNIMTNNKYSTVNSGVTSVISIGYGKHYFSVMDENTAAPKYTLNRFLVTSTGTGTPQLGVYETQNQLFSKKISVKQIRVYTEPTVANNGFQLDMIGNDGNVITNGSFTYSYSAGTDVTLLQGSLERINFNPSCKDLYSLGIRITNTGTVNMLINKIEIDWEESGK